MPLAIASEMPALTSVGEWLNGSVDAAGLAGEPTLVQFWAVSCPVCKDNIPKLQQFLETYQAQGLRLVSVHMPRMEADMDVERVKAAVQEMGLTGPCAIDNDHKLGDKFQTGGVWPCYFLFDAEGKLRSRAAGAMGLMMAENSLKRLLDLGTKL